MRILIVFAQVVIAVLAGGLILPAILFAVPQTREFGPVVPALLVAGLFGLVHMVWPKRTRVT